MIWLGRYIAGESVRYGAVFHDENNTPTDPTSPAARHRDESGSFADLAAPAKLDSKDGFYGGAVDTTGFSDGIHAVRLSGTVDSVEHATIFHFGIGNCEAATTWFFSGAFHDESNSNAAVDPTAPAARLLAPDGTFSDLTAPAKIDSKTGWFGNTIDTTGFTTGKYRYYLTGTVNGHSVGGVGEFEVFPSSVTDEPGMSTWAVSEIDSGEYTGKLVTVATDAETVVPAYRVRNDTVPNDWTLGTPIATPTAGDEFTVSGLTDGVIYETTVISKAVGNYLGLPGNVVDVTPGPAADAETGLDSRLRPVAGRLIDTYGKYAVYHVPQYVTDQAAGTRTKTDNNYPVKISPPEGFNAEYETFDHLKPGDRKTYLSDLDVDGNQLQFTPDTGHAITFDGERWEIVAVAEIKTGKLAGVWTLFIRSKK